MNSVWDILLSPYGLAAYAGFWGFKLLAGAWIMRRMMRLVPVRAQTWGAGKLARLKLNGRSRPLG